MRRAVRWSAYTCAVLFGVPLLLLLLLTLLANFGAGRRLIESAVKDLSGGQVQLTGIGGRFPDRLRLARLQVADHQGQWLDVEGARLDWSPTQLLELTVSVQDVGADRVAVLYAPDYPPKHPRKPSTGPGLWRKLHFDLQHLAVARLELGAALAGEPVAARIQAVGRLRSLEQLNLQFDAQRLDNVPSVYHLLATMQDAKLAAQLDLEEGAGGPLSHLTHLPGLGIITVRAQLMGALNALQTDLDAHTDTLRASAHGQLDLPARAANLDATLDADAMAPRSWMEWRHISLRAQARGALTDPRTSAHLDAQGLKFGPIVLGNASADLHGEGAALGLTTVVQGLVLPAPVHGLLAQDPVNAQARFQFGGGRAPLLEVSLRHRLLQGQGRYTFDKQRSGSFNATLPDLAPVVQMIGLHLMGSAQVQGTLQAADHAERLTLSNALHITGGAAPLAGLLRPRAQLSTSLVIGGPDGVLIQGAQLRGPGVLARTEGKASSAGLDLRSSLSLSDLRLVASGLSGQLSAQGRIDGQMPQLEIALDAGGSVSAQGSAPGNLELSVQAHGIPERPVLRMNLSGELDSAPLQLVLNARRGVDGPFQIQIERGAWKSFHAAGALDVGSDGRSPQGQLRLSIGQLQDFAHLLRQPLQGSLTAQADAVSTHGEPGVRLSLTALQLGVPSQQIEQLALQGELTDIRRTPQLSLDLSARATRSDTQAQLTLHAHGPVSELQLQLDGHAERPHAPTLELQSAATWLSAQRALRVDSLTLSYEQDRLRLLAPSTLHYADGLALDELRLGLGAAVLRAQGRLLPTLDVRAALRNFTPQLVRALVPDLDADGTVSADLNLQGPPTQPSGTVSVAALQFRARSGALRGLPTLDLHAQAQLAAGNAQLQLQLDAGKELQLKVDGQLPLARGAPIALKLEGHGNLAAANPVLEASGQRALGQLRIDATLSGTLAAPQPQGTLTLINADLQDYPRGLHLTKINMLAQGDGERLALKQFSANAGSGTLSASGDIAFGGAGDMPVNLKVEARDAQPFASDLLTANLDAGVTVSGALRDAWSDRSTLSAAGQLHVNHAEINVPNALPPNVEVLNVVRPGQKPQQPASAHALRVRLDVTIDAPRAVFVRGRGLDAELGGSLHVGGVSTEPAISGALNMRSGTFALGGTTLTFSSGTVSFNGSGVRHRIDPTLDFLATSISNSVTSRLEITGYADSPLIKLDSTPEMPQDQILSQLLFGENITQLSALQIAQIGAALATMSGIGGNGGGFNPINSLQRRLGLDRLAISGGGGGNSATSTTGASGTSTTQNNVGATIEAGRYVSNRVFIGAKQSTTGATQGEVQVDLTRHLKMQGAVGTGGATSVQGATPQNDPGSSVGFSYQLEY